MPTTCPTCGKTHTRTGSLCRRCAGDAANTLMVDTHTRSDFGFAIAKKGERIGTAPNHEVAPSARSLTNPSPESAKTRGERMATENDSARRAVSA